MALLSLLAISACAPSPTTTYTNSAGQEVTVSWKDYPAESYRVAEGLLGAPAKEDAEAISATLLEEIKTALGREFELHWSSSGESSWYPDGGNGYGGKAMTSTYNSVSWDSDTAPATTAEWERTIAVVSRVTASHGLGTVQLSPDADDLQNDPEWRKDLLKKYGTADPKKLWWWIGTAYADSQWLSVDITNIDRDTTGAAAAEYEDSSHPPRSISLSYGVTTLAKGDLPAFMQALAPFEGLTPPEPTRSD